MPQTGTSEKRAWVSPNLAEVEATMMSPHNASSSPPVRAKPVIAAMIGPWNTAMPKRVCPAPTSSSGACKMASVDESSFRSTPAQKARPRPVRITTRVSAPSPAKAAIS